MATTTTRRPRAARARRRRSSRTSSRTSPSRRRRASDAFPAPPRSSRGRTGSREGALPLARHPDRPLRRRSRKRGCPRSSSRGGSATTARGSGASRRAEPLSERRARGGARPLRPRALDRRRPGQGRRHALLAPRRERPPRRDPPRDAGARRRRPAGARPRRSARPLLDALDYVGVLARRAVRGRGPPARERVRAARAQHGALDDRRRRRRASSRTTCGRSSACRSVPTDARAPSRDGQPDRLRARPRRAARLPRRARAPLRQGCRARGARSAT